MTLKTTNKPAKLTPEEEAQQRLNAAMPQTGVSRTLDLINGTDSGGQGGDPYNTGVDLQGNMDPVDYQMKQLMDYAEKTKRQNQGMLEDYLKPKIDNYERAGATANNQDRGWLLQQGALGDQTIGNINGIVGEAEDMYGDYAGQMTGLADQDQGALRDYMGKNAGLVDQVGNYSWEDAQSAKEGVDAQNKALSKYESLLDPTATAQEKYLMELGRRKQEQGERSSRDAVMSDLGARGMRGSGMELTNMLGAQEQLGQDRVLSNLGMQANAVDRSMQALQGYGNTAGQMRQYGDIIQMFNAQGNNTAKQWKIEQDAKLAEAAAKQTRETTEGVGKHLGEGYDAGTAMLGGKYKAEQDKYGIGRDFIQEGQGATQRAFDRTGRTTGAASDYASMWTGGNRADSAPIYAGYQQLAGNAAADKAADEAERNTPFLDIPFVNVRAGKRTIL